MRSADRPRRRRLRLSAASGLVLGGSLLVLAVAWLGGCQRQPPPLVVYCTHDRHFAEEILDRFTQETGIRVAARYDSELTKSFELAAAIYAERESPICEVFWNNEALGMLQLQRAGRLEPYQGPGWQRIPEAWKDPDGAWAGFAGRFRVWIVNTNRLSPTPEAIDAALEQPTLYHFTFAGPQYGTTRTQFAVMWDLWGDHRVRLLMSEWATPPEGGGRGAELARSNGHVKNLVAAGACTLGWTDTDDYFLAQDAGSPVAMLPLRINESRISAAPDGGQTIFMPNTVGIIKGARNVEAARRLADFLLSAEVELALAQSASRQVPIGPVDEGQLPPEVRELMPLVAESVPMEVAGRAHQEVAQWLQGR